MLGTAGGYYNSDKIPYLFHPDATINFAALFRPAIWDKNSSFFCTISDANK